MGLAMEQGSKKDLKKFYRQLDFTPLIIIANFMTKDAMDWREAWCKSKKPIGLLQP